MLLEHKIPTVPASLTMNTNSKRIAPPLRSSGSYFGARITASAFVISDKRVCGLHMRIVVFADRTSQVWKVGRVAIKQLCIVRILDTANNSSSSHVVSLRMSAYRMTRDALSVTFLLGAGPVVHPLADRISDVRYLDLLNSNGAIPSRTVQLPFNRFSDTSSKFSDR